MKRAVLIASLLFLPVAMTACQTAPSSESDKSTLAAEVDAALTAFKNDDSSLGKELAGAAGYAVFPSVGKGGLIAGGAYGKGELFVGGKKVGFCDLSQATLGLQAGVQTFSELIIFKSNSAVDKFKNNRTEFAANASAVAIKPGAAASAKYTDDVAVFVRTTGGLMAEASLGGQRFTYKAY